MKQRVNSRATDNGSQFEPTQNSRRSILLTSFGGSFSCMFILFGGR